MKKSILVLLALVAVVLCSCEKPPMYSYILQNDLPDSLIIKKVGRYGYSESSVAANEYERWGDRFGPWEYVAYYNAPEKFDFFLFTYKGKTYREDRRGGYSALNSAVYSKPTQGELQFFLVHYFMFNVTEEYLATLPEVTD